MGTRDLVNIIGSPFIDDVPEVNDAILHDVYDEAFRNRVGLLYLSLHRKPGWPEALGEKYRMLHDRMLKTLNVMSSLGASLNTCAPEKYAIFKSIKPYPATPNDTDVILFGNKTDFKNVLAHLYSEGYTFHEWAPMQTTLIHPSGIGKTGKGKRGGTYYIDIYSEISTDYFMYIDKRRLLPYVETVEVAGRKIQGIRKEIELAIILFHNVFPERTFQLEHFYMPLWHLHNEHFDLELFIGFVEEQRLTRAVAANLALVEYLHNEIFGFSPCKVQRLLDKWGRNAGELGRFTGTGAAAPYMFSPKTFWLSFYDKLYDKTAAGSLLVQALHMLNPVFFFEVMRSLKRRFSEKGNYHLE